MVSAWASLIGPFYEYFQDGTKVTLYNMRIPLIDQHSNMQFTINVIWESLMNLFGVIAIVFVEAAHATVNNSVTVSSKLNVLSFSALSNQMERQEITHEQSHRQLKYIFMNIIYWDECVLIHCSKKINRKRFIVTCHFSFRYINKFEYVLYWRLFLSPPMFTLSIAISIYSQNKVFYPFIIIIEYYLY